MVISETVEMSSVEIMQLILEQVDRNSAIWYDLQRLRILKLLEKTRLKNMEIQRRKIRQSKVYAIA